jgi:Fe-S-cluster containining protein
MLNPLAKFIAFRTQAVDTWNAGVHHQFEGRLTCGPGCEPCCRLMAFCAFSEAVVLASACPEEVLDLAVEQGVRQVALLQEAGWDPRPTIFHERKRKEAVGVASTAWHELGERCPFLTPETTCSIYAIRPAVCSTVWSLCPKERCLAESDTTTLVKNAEVLEYVAKLDQAAMRELGVSSNNPHISYLPIGAMIANARAWLAGELAAKPKPEERRILGLGENRPGLVLVPGT